MYVERLALTNVRTFRELGLALGRGAHLVTGPNASGKSNLLESLSMLATTRSVRGGSDLDLVSWAALEEDPLPAARLQAQVAARDGAVTVEVIVTCNERRPDGSWQTSRRFRVNGIARRASDLIGRLRVVAFSADDLELFDGSPARRRRYLDITISQLEPAYVRALQRYSRVLAQRNSLLRRLQERRAVSGRGNRPHELDFWDQELAASGALLARSRAAALRALDREAARQYLELAPAGEPLSVCYRPALPEPLAAALVAGEDSEGLGSELLTALAERRGADVQAGMTRIGPHRDDVSFLVGGREAGAFASRGQQRTAALALRLAEVRLSTERTGDPPVLLLDDILSELDAERRARVLAAAYEVDQVVITSADEDRYGGELPSARRFRIEGGAVVPAG